MHELSLMENALQIAVDEARRRDARRIHRLTLRIGELSGVVPEALAFAFEALAPGTLAEGAELLLETTPVICHCAGCGASFHPATVIYACPECGQISGDIQRGQELELASLEVS